jgi:hypothetical protein
VAVSGLVERLVELAFAHAEPEAANVGIARAREAWASGGTPGLSYEAALPALDPEQYLTHRLLPRLVYFLDCRGAPMTGGEGVFVSLFTPSGLHFIDAGTLVATVAAARGLTAEDLVRRYGQQGVGDPPLLGG